MNLWHSTVKVVRDNSREDNLKTFTTHHTQFIVELREITFTMNDRLVTHTKPRMGIASLVLTLV